MCYLIAREEEKKTRRRVFTVDIKKKENKMELNVRYTKTKKKTIKEEDICIRTWIRIVE